MFKLKSVHKRLYVALLVAFVLSFIATSPVLAYLYRATLTIAESVGTDYTELPVTCSVDVEWLIDNGFITTSTALDTRVETFGGTEQIHMVADDRIMAFAPSLDGNSQLNWYLTTGNAALTGFPVIVGVGGYVTIADDATMELGSAFEVEFKGYIDTSAGSNKDIIYKENAFRVYVQAEDSIRAAILTTGDSEVKAVTVTGIDSQDLRVLVTADSVYMDMYIWDASGTSLGTDTIALDSTTTPDNTNIWYLMRNNSAPYLEYLKLRV